VNQNLTTFDAQRKLNASGAAGAVQEDHGSQVAVGLTMMEQIKGRSKKRLEESKEEVPQLRQRFYITP